MLKKYVFCVCPNFLQPMKNNTTYFEFLTGSMFAIIFFWVAVAAPLALGGSYMGFTKDPPMEFPLQSDTMPRPIPDQPWFLGVGPTVILTLYSSVSIAYMF